MEVAASRRSCCRASRPGLDGRHELGDRAARNRLADGLSRHAEDELPLERRLDFLRDIAGQLDVDIESVLVRRSFHLMTSAQLRELSAGGVDLQLHTHRHRFPPDDRAGCIEEIDRNRRFLEQVTGAVAAHFCYPSGEFRPHQKAWLRELGVD